MPSEPNTGPDGSVMRSRRRDNRRLHYNQRVPLLSPFLYSSEKLCIVEIIVEEEGGVSRERGLESRLLIKWSKQRKWS